VKRAALVFLCACTALPAGLPVEEVTALEVSEALEALSPPEVRAHAGAYRDRLVDALAKDDYACLPPVDVALGPPPPGVSERTIRGQLPHYDFFSGPIRYRVRGDGARWLVSLRIAVEPSDDEGTLELPSCPDKKRYDGPIVCEGTPYADAPGTDACPGSGRFEVPVTPRNLRALMADWSHEVEAYWNRDAKKYDLPVRYDFDFVLAAGPARSPVDVRMPLYLSCGRTPYFTAMRSGWSIPIVAHEIGHYLGLLDEYEALSGMLYEKTPFGGAETSRMGLSMKKNTRLYPLHHYLVLRRYHCPEPQDRGEPPPVL
jgi:hypothetical protein